MRRREGASVEEKNLLGMETFQLIYLEENYLNKPTDFFIVLRSRFMYFHPIILRGMHT